MMSLTEESRQNRKIKRNVEVSPYFNSRRSPPKEKTIAGDCASDMGSVTKTNSIFAGDSLKSRLGFEFFNQPCVDLAKALLGTVLVRVTPQKQILRGMIVETESYLGNDDKASLSYGGKMTERSKPMYMKPGTTFVYLTYGMYNLINISSQGDGAAVLIRALEPIEGLEEMDLNRQEFQPNRNKPKKPKKTIPAKELCNGPAKLCISFGIVKDQCNMQDLSTWDEMWIEQNEIIPEEQIVKSRRIGIDSAGPEWANKLLRYYILNNKCVSKRDKDQENLLKLSHSCMVHNV